MVRAGKRQHDADGAQGGPGRPVADEDMAGMMVERVLLEPVRARFESALLAVDAVAQPLCVPHLVRRAGDDNDQLVARGDDCVAESGLKHVDPP
jgi:hypothetical protein